MQHSLGSIRSAAAAPLLGSAAALPGFTPPVSWTNILSCCPLKNHGRIQSRTRTPEENAQLVGAVPHRSRPVCPGVNPLSALSFAYTLGPSPPVWQIQDYLTKQAQVAADSPNTAGFTWGAGRTGPQDAAAALRRLQPQAGVTVGDLRFAVYRAERHGVLPKQQVSSPACSLLPASHWPLCTMWPPPRTPLLELGSRRVAHLAASAVGCCHQRCSLGCISWPASVCLPCAAGKVAVSGGSQNRAVWPAGIPVHGRRAGLPQADAAGRRRRPRSCGVRRWAAAATWRLRGSGTGRRGVVEAYSVVRPRCNADGRDFDANLDREHLRGMTERVRCRRQHAAPGVPWLMCVCTCVWVCGCGCVGVGVGGGGGGGLPQPPPPRAWRRWTLACKTMARSCSLCASLPSSVASRRRSCCPR
jgi:hypothetical protein